MFRACGSLTPVPPSLPVPWFHGLPQRTQLAGFCDRRYTPTYRGFDSFLGYLEGAEDYWTHSRAAGGYSGYDFRNGSTAGALAPVLKLEQDYSAHIFAREAQRRVRAHNQSRPFFLYLAFQSVHAPLQAPDRFMRMYRGKMGGDKDRQTVAAMVTAMDEAIGNITQTLNETGMLRDTVMVFTTDNGGPNPTHNNYPLRGGKATTWEGGVRGTGWVRGTESGLAPVQGGRATTALMHTTDWLPTIVQGLAKVDPARPPPRAGAAGASTAAAPLPLPLDGTNQWHAIASPAGVSRRSIVAHNVPTAGFSGAFRWGHLKVLFEGMQTTVPARPQLPPQGFTPAAGADTVPAAVPYGGANANGTVRAYLFNITADPTESNNLLLSADGAYDDAMADIVNAYLAYQADKAAPVVEDLSVSHTAGDPTANPATHTDQAWGPFDMSTLANHTSKCDYV